MFSSFVVPLEAVVTSQPVAIVPTQSVDIGVFGALHGAALAPLALGAMLWVVLLVAMRVVRDARDARAGAPRIVTPPSRDGVPAAA